MKKGRAHKRVRPSYAVRADGTVWQWIPLQPGEPALLLPVDGLTDAVAVHYSRAEATPQSSLPLRAGFFAWGRRLCPPQCVLLNNTETA